jgi:hypothetical protein
MPKIQFGKQQILTFWNDYMLITLELPVEEVNFILEMLSEEPYRDVSEIIAKIQNQGRPQVEAAELAAAQEEQAEATEE